MSAAGTPALPSGRRGRYGASPLHLLAHLAAFALAGWVLLQWIDARGFFDVVLWFAGAVILHDLVLLPAYTLLDRAWRRTTGPAVNYLRVPLGIAVLLLAVFFPVICARGEDNFTRVSGIGYEGYLERWLLACAVLFGVSLAVWLVRSRGGSKS